MKYYFTLIFFSKNGIISIIGLQVWVQAPGSVVRLDHLGARPHGLDAVGLELHPYQAREAPLLFSMGRVCNATA
jgi:hypothetical protein